jgi:hypothetical protein
MMQNHSEDISECHLLNLTSYCPLLDHISVRIYMDADQYLYNRVGLNSHLLHPNRQYTFTNVIIQVQEKNEQENINYPQHSVWSPPDPRYRLALHALAMIPPPLANPGSAAARLGQFGQKF